jgi:hypothetical protein
MPAQDLLIALAMVLFFAATMYAIFRKPPAKGEPAKQPEALTIPHAAPPLNNREAGSAPLCIALGIAFMLAGGYFLLIAPGGSTEFGARAIANIHRLTLGETSSIVGAIFLAAGIRPR